MKSSSKEKSKLKVNEIRNEKHFDQKKVENKKEKSNNKSILDIINDGKYYENYIFQNYFIFNIITLLLPLLFFLLTLIIII